MNLDTKTINSFGEEWHYYNHINLDDGFIEKYFNDYFAIFPWDLISKNAVGFDLGCGSGRWSRFVAPKVGTLHCIDASEKALEIAKINCKDIDNCVFHLCSIENITSEDNYFDFGFSLGVLHHVPNTASALDIAVKKLKKGAPLLLYLYFSFDNKPVWYKLLWKVSDLFRKIISKLPFKIKLVTCKVIASFIYFPFSRLAIFFDYLRFNTNHFPLAYYKNSSLYTMENDALDRFGTSIEHRFSKVEIENMMKLAGLSDIKFSSNPPFWVSVGYKN
jgi:SAM-dependent methyltransferase